MAVTDAIAAYAEFAGLVTGGGNDAALGRAAHGDRFSAEIRIVPLLDGRVECIHTDMDEGSMCRKLTFAENSFEVLWLVSHMKPMSEAAIVDSFHFDIAAFL